MTVTVDGTLGVSLAAANSVPLGAVQSAAIVASSLSGAQTGSAPIYGCRAWCNFDGTLTGTNAPRAGGNVTSVTRNSVGDYTINFTTAMPDANYTIALGSISYTASNTSTLLFVKAGTTTTVPALKTINSLEVVYCSTTAAFYDASEINVMIFR